MKSRRGFTLIELLAVIVILAIIIILVIPRVLIALDTAKKNAFKAYCGKVIDKAIEKRETDLLLDSQNGSNNTKDCYTLEDLNFKETSKYSGSVQYLDGKFYIYLADKEYYAPGLTIDQINKLDGILSKNDEGFKAEASTSCS